MDMCARDGDHKRTHTRTRAPSDVIESEREVVGGLREKTEKGEWEVSWLFNYGTW